MPAVNTETTIWPRPGLALLPRFIRRVWGHRSVPIAVLERAGLPESTKIAELDDDIWTYATDPGGLRVLANYLQRLVYNAIYFQGDSELAHARVFHAIIPDSLDIAQLRLTTRTLNLVRQSTRLRDASWLRNVTADRICAVPGVGSRVFLELATTIEEQLPADEPTSRPAARVMKANLEEQIKSLSNDFPIDEISPMDPRLSGLDLSGRTIDSALRNRLGLEGAEGQARLGFESEDQSLIGRVRSTLENLRDETLDRALANLIRSCLKSPHTPLVAMRLGWDGQGGSTLQQAADKANITRERIRQLESKLKNNLIHVSYLPALEKSLAALETAAMTFEPDASLTLLDAGLATGRFLPAGVENAAKLLNIGKVGFSVAPNGKSITPPDGGIEKSVWNAVRSLSNVNYVTTVNEVKARVEDATSEKPEVGAVKSILATNDRVIWLDDIRDWFWFRQNEGRNRWLNVTRKLLAVSNPILISALRDGLRRSHGNRAVNVPTGVLRRLCREAGLKAENDQSTVEGTFDRAELLNPSELILHSALENAGGILRREDLQEACFKRGMNRHSFWVYLSYNPLLIRLAPSVYGLRGRNFSASQVAALADVPQVPKKKVLRDHGWTRDGSIWIGYSLSNNTVQSGVLSVPSEVREVLGADQFELYGIDGANMGTFRIGDHGSAWGLTPYFDRRGVEEGDALIIIINTDLAAAVVRSGSNELLEMYELDEGQGVRDILESVTMPGEMD